MHPLLAAVILGPPIFGICEDIVDYGQRRSKTARPVAELRS